jgi:hypothetical protein
MNQVYIINHVNPKNDDEKYIGVYSSYEEAAKVVETYKKFKGFKDAPDHFYIDKYEIGKLYWPEGYYSVKVKVKNKSSSKT